VEANQSIKCPIGKLEPYREYLIELMVQPPSSDLWTPPAARRSGVKCFRTELICLSDPLNPLIVARSGSPNHD